MIIINSIVVVVVVNVFKNAIYTPPARPYQKRSFFPVRGNGQKKVGAS